VASQAAMLATSSIPIVGVAMTNHPAGQGIAGRKLTGLTTPLTDLTGRHLELLLEIVPTISRVGLLWNSAYLDSARFHPQGDAELLRLARARGIRVHYLEVRAASVLDAALVSATRGRIDGLVVLGDPLTFAHRSRIIEFANQNRLPSVYDLHEFAEDGGLLANGFSLRPLYRRAANHLDKILKGTDPAEIPIERAHGSQLVVNARTAQAMGLTIPDALLQQAIRIVT